MSPSVLKRARKPVLAVGLGIILYLIATNAGAGWLYVISAAIGRVILVSAAVPWWNVRNVEVSRRARRWHHGRALGVRPGGPEYGPPCPAPLGGGGPFRGGKGSRGADARHTQEPEVVRYTI